MFPVRLCGILPRTEREEADKMVQSMSRRQSSDYEFLLRRPSAILETQFEVCKTVVAGTPLCDW